MSSLPLAFITPLKSQSSHEHGSVVVEHPIHERIRSAMSQVSVKSHRLAMFKVCFMLIMVIPTVIDVVHAGGHGGCRRVHQTVSEVVHEAAEGHLCRKGFKKSCTQVHKNLLGRAKKHIVCNKDHRATLCETEIKANFGEKCTTVYRKKCEWGRKSIGAAKWETRCNLHAGPYGKAICREVPRGGLSREATRCRVIPERVCRHVALNEPKKSCYSVAKARCNQNLGKNTQKYALGSTRCFPRAQQLCRRVTKTIPKKRSYQVAKVVCKKW